MTQEECFRDVLVRWEGGLSLDPADKGNWFAAPGREAQLVGSCHGVTPAALARFRGCSTVSRADMAALTLEEAIQVGLRLFLRDPGFDRLPWDAIVASVVDFGWGAGTAVAVRKLQTMVGVNVDGCLGPRTTQAYRAHVAAHGLSASAKGWGEIRNRFYRALAAAWPADAKYLTGWQRRSAYFLPGTPWWQRFTGAA